MLSALLLCSGSLLSSCDNNKESPISQKSDQEKDIGLKLSEESVTLNVNGTKQVTATTDDDSIYLVTWQSSNKEIATVKSGLITGISEGEATITASARKKGSTKVLQTKSVKVIVNNHTLTLDKSEEVRN